MRNLKLSHSRRLSSLLLMQVKNFFHVMMLISALLFSANVAASNISNMGFISGTLILDADQNAKADIMEAGQQGVKLILLNEKGEVHSSSVTDPYGSFAFENLENGKSYKIVLDKTTVKTHNEYVNNVFIQSELILAPNKNTEVLMIEKPNVWMKRNVLSSYSEAFINEGDPQINIHIDNFDLALRMTPVVNNARRGELIDFEIEVFNQGYIPADEIVLVNYLPAGFLLADSDWILDEDDSSKAYYTASVENGGLPMLGLAASKSVKIEITLRTEEFQPLGTLTTFAEIYSAHDLYGNDLGIYDEDSTPDNEFGNDTGGQANTPTDDEIDDDGTLDEDDSDPAQVYLTSLVLNADCVCQDNAGLMTIGQFYDELKLTAPTSQNWVVQSVTGLIGVNVGDPLNEIYLPHGYSKYILGAMHEDGLGYEVTFVNNLGDTEFYSKEAGECTYEAIIVEGPKGNCVGASIEYSVQNPDPDAIYDWLLPDGSNQQGIEIIFDWGGLAPGTYQLIVSNAGGPACQSPGLLEVVIGTTVYHSLVSKDEVIASVNQLCEAEITAQMVLNYGYHPSTPFIVTLTDPQGNVLPSNTITSEYLYIPLTVRVDDMCGGNWATSLVTAIDKLPPTIDCSDEYVACEYMDEYEGPIVEDNCDDDPEIILVNEQVFNENCESQYSRRIERTYMALDNSGNFSELCTKNIYTERAETENLEWPEDLLHGENSALVCGTFPTCPSCDCDTFPYPDPLATGVPTLNGEPIYPSVVGHCQYMVGFEDLILINTPCFKKLKRFWSVHEICEGGNVFNILSYTQDIEIVDLLPPIPEFIEDIYLSTDGENCGNTVQLPPVSAIDNCDSEISVNMLYPGGFLEDTNGATVWMPEGVNSVLYTLFDECGNQSQIEYQVVIEDFTPPVAICQENTVVVLQNDGFAEVPADVFDSGSYDDCTIVDMEVKRNEEDETCGLFQNEFGPSVTFCCEDAGKSILVTLKVYDGNGNWSECDVEIMVQDIIAPILTIPQDVTIDCDYPYNLDDLESYFGSASVYDVCGAEISYQQVEYITSCGVGYIDRIFTASDGLNTITKTQKIYIENTEPYNFENIDWPEDYLTAESCNAGDLVPANLPEGYDFPTFPEETNCDQLGFTFVDEVFAIEEMGNSCYKIVRTWKVMDLCNLIEDQYRTWYWDQIIMVINSEDPEIVSDLGPVVECAFDDDCLSGYIELSASGMDDCTPGNNLYWEYAIDLGNDGIIDDEGSITGETLDLSGDYPIGEHTVYWTLADYCGNFVHKAQYIKLNNCKKPTAVCIDAVSVGIEATDLTGDGIPDTELAIIYADAFDGGSYHSCGYPVTLSFSEDITDTSMVVDCEDLSFTGVEITLYVTDPFGNFDICETVLYVQDNNNDEICDQYDGCVLLPDVELFIESCDPNLDPSALNSMVTVEGDCPCQDYEIEWEDTDISDPNNTCITLQRDWTVTFDCGVDKTYHFQQIIEILNVTAPILNCSLDIEVDSPSNCEAYVTIPVPQISSEVCNTGLFIVHNSVYADLPGENASGTYPVGSTTVTFTLEDECGNQSTCDLVVTVNDITPPECVTTDLSLGLGPNGTVTISGEDINGGSTDECGIAGFSVAPNLFDCEDVGDNTVTLTVIDIHGNSSTCTAIVTIEDESGPLCSTQDLDIILDASGNYTLDPTEIFTGSPCGGLDVELSLDQTDFSCDDLGVNEVTLTVTESNGNSESCTALVTVSDTIAPLCLLLDITAYLDSNGEISVTFEDIDDGTTDPCGEIIDTTITNTDFTCTDVGEHIVTVTCTDDSGNISVCEAIVTVADTIAPSCSVNDITVSIGGNGQVEVTGEDLDAGSSDICGIDEIVVNPSIFTCENIGENEVTVTVTDVNGVSSVCTATVTVEDNSGPLCSTQDIDIILDGNGQYFLDPEEIYTGASCGSGEVTLEVNPAILDCEDLGEVIVTLTVSDEFGTVESCTATIGVSDTLAPICAVQDIDLFLDGSGAASFVFSDIDIGSEDPCGEIVETTFGPSSFNCDDIGVHTVSVSLTDDNGNVSVCEAEVTVADTLSPVCSTQDIIVDLDDSGVAVITADQVNDGSSDNCSDITMEVEPNTFSCSDVGFVEVILTVTDASGNTSTCTADVQVRDLNPPVITCPPDTSLFCTDWPISDYSIFGVATATDDCDEDMAMNEILIENVNSCGIGVVTRIFYAQDDNQNQSTCTQVITFENSDPPFGEDNIIWGPALITTDGCNDLDINTIGGAPGYIFMNEECYILNDFYEDVDLNPNEACLDTIMRTWTVIDSCQYNESTGAGVWTFEQMILAIDTLLPVIVAPGDTTICEEEFVDLYGYATDCGSEDNVTVTNDSEFAYDQNSADVSGDYDYGTHNVTITAVDECGNVATHSLQIKVYQFWGECRKVIRDIEDDLMYVLYLDEIWHPNPNCFDTAIYKFSLSTTNIDQDTLHFDCDDLGGASFVDIDIPVYMWENGVYIEEYCAGLLTLEDADGFCEGNIAPVVSGELMTFMGDGIENADVHLLGTESHNRNSDHKGRFVFPAQTMGTEWELYPQKNDDVRNGLSTLDLIFMQRHLLGITPFEEAYQYIAADINNSLSISAADVLELRQLILGTKDEFSNNQSWRFLDANFEFQNTSDPLSEVIPDQYQIPSLETNRKIDFNGIKIGDLNASAVANSDMEIEGRSNEKVELYTTTERVIQGEEVILPVKSTKGLLLNGMQMTIKIDPDVVEFSNITSALLNISNSNYGVSYAEEGLITFSWHSSNPIAVVQDEVLFNIQLKASANALTKEVIEFSDDKLVSEWYSSMYDNKGIEFRIGKDHEFELFQNTPNPWSNTTELTYRISDSGNVRIAILDVYGRLLKEYNVASNKGLNRIVIDQNDFNAKGILIYELEFNGIKKNRKMIKIN